MTSAPSAGSGSGRDAAPVSDPIQGHAASDDGSPVLRPLHKRRSFATLRTLFALMLREMVTSYGRSPGGYLWAVVEPAAGTALMTLVFSLGFRSPPLGSNFAIFYASGLVPFLMYLDLSGKIASSIQYSRSLLVYPSVTFLDAILARFILNGITQIMVAYIVLSFIVIGLHAPVSVNFDKIALGFAMVLVLALGIGTLNCFLFSVAPLWQRAWGILTRPLFIMSCIFFIFDSVPRPYQDYLWYNPLIHIVGTVRSGLYARYDASYASPTYVFTVGAVSLVVGLLFLRRYHRDILNT